MILTLIAPALRFADKRPRNYWKTHLVIYAFIVWVLDVFLAHTLWAGVFGYPHKGELTISDTLERLCVTPQRHKAWLIGLALSINNISPGHIKAVA